MNEFTIYPAVDLRNGRVVRLFQGDPERETEYGNPTEAARRWITQGAKWLHVVNLDGALGEETSANADALEQILQVSSSLGARVQFGGGIRKLQDLERILGLGVERVILGTAAVRQPALAQEAIKQFGPDTVVVGADLRDGQLRIQGWKESADSDPIRWGSDLRAAGVKWAVHTDISRDGAGRGLNAGAAAAFQERTGLQVIAAGGVSGFKDILRAKEHGLHGVITGKALYEGKLDLEDAIRRLKGGF
ncbi:MAG: 1-(5-phosphoribosyl)-5-[(5-phosphoribosylamino)methylideneamino] imidazole-4-carboxamide isomerase [Anaerolineales bacterium]|nr:1-(5-phosphoribosyl)-5-[(5-phosphoribosylamino)methylideneamino] imidazole-4-carboxamide isomerase [Anaerolineales bacterium]